MSTKTPLQQAIKDALRDHPTADDEEIARIAFSVIHPGEEYRKSSPTPQYVSKIRGRVSLESQSPEVIVNPEEIPEPQTPEEQAAEETATEPFTLPGDEPKTETPTEPSLFDGKKIIKSGFDGLAAFTSWEGWKLDPKDDTDADFLDATERMIEKYAPGAIEQFGDELMFLVATATTIGPRVRDYRKHLDEATKKAIPAEYQVHPKAEDTAAASEIPPATPPPEATKPPAPAVDDTPRSVGDEAFKRRIGGHLS